MSRTLKLYLVALLVVSMICIIWFFVQAKEETPPEETNQVEACDSCTARHQNLTRLRDARNLTASPDE